MKLILQRSTPAGKPRTFGELIDEIGARICYTLEDQVRTGAKVHGETAIPAGEYKVTLEMSNRFGPGTLTVNNVPGFVAIRMHGGNTEKDSEGCPLLGLNKTDAGINNCAPAVNKVKKLVGDALARGEAVTLEVINA